MDLKSNEPFWLVKNGIINSYPSLREDKECDILIVGGGITGSLIAHQCVDEGYKTILIDKREIANGSSSATTSMLQYEIDTPLYKLSEMIGEEGAIESYKACYDSINILERICKKINSKAGFNKKQSLYFSAYKKDVDWLKREFESRKAAGFEVKWLSPEDIVKKYNIYNTQGGILSQQGSSVDAFMLVHELLAYNIKRGLEVYDKTEADSVKSNSKYNEVTTNTQVKIKTKKIIYCIGYESAQMIKEKFVDLISTYAIVSEINDDTQKFDDVLIWNTQDPYIYLRTTTDGRFLIGGEDEEFINPKKRDQIISKKQEKLLKSFEKYIPDAHFYPDFAWGGTFGITKDGLPYIGEHPDFKNSYFVLGFGGNGITFSVIGMEMASHWLKNKKHTLSELFRFGR